jgi:hypothetical protein
MFTDWVPPSATLLVGILGVGGTFLAGERLRRHGQQLSHEQREQDRRATAYVDVLVSSERIRNWIWSIHPKSEIGTFPAPDGPSADEQAKTKALLLAYGSEKVRRLFGGWDDAAQEAIGLAHQITFHKSRDDATEVTDLLERLHDKAKPAERAAREALAERINLELRGEPYGTSAG